MPFYHSTVDLYERWKVLSVRQLYILYTVIKQHSLLKYEPDKFKNQRRKDTVCTTKLFKTKLAHIFFCYQGFNLYNKLNRKLSMYLFIAKK